jgi:hypothetical protein
MRITLLLIAAIALQGCKEIECGEGTIERNGSCEPRDLSVDPAKCGANTIAVGDQCLPRFEPTVCDPQTTAEDLNTTTNIITCIGTGGGGGCGAPIACPQPASGKQTICGQLYNLENNELFTAADSTGARCDPAMPATAGPCALRINAYDAIAFANNPNTPPLVVGDTFIDECGRYRITDITPPTGSPFIALGIDDVDPTKAGPGGVTNAAGLAQPNVPDMALKDIEAFVVPATTTTKWAQTGGPTLATGIYAMIFRQRRAPSRLTQAGVTVLKGVPPNFAPTPTTDNYFVNTDVQRERVDMAANVTGANGTALVAPAALTDGAFTGLPTGVLPAECRWSAHPAQTVMGVVFVQILRPVNGTGTCPL